jgi:hypothetical protein
VYVCELCHESTVRLLLLLDSAGSGNAEGDLDGVVNEPLQSGQGTDHDHAGAESLPEARPAGGGGLTVSCVCLCVCVRESESV